MTRKNFSILKLTKRPIDQQLPTLNMDIACVVMNTVVIGDLRAKSD